ncbi:MAG TPA: response regulator [Stellaceae bacterium]|nr:response regulator [Stellaceae bacterium]
MRATALDIAGLLPSLRRYARAVTGSSEDGDRWIACCLERLLLDHDSMVPEETPRSALFRLLHRTAPEIRQTAAPGADEPSQERLEREILTLPLLDREVFLLATLEGFPLDEVALLTELDLDEVKARLGAARQKLSPLVSGRVLIIEDEPIVAMDLVNVVRSAGHVLTGVAPTNRRALELVRDRAPDVILADVRLRAGDSGIATIKQILQTGSLPVIFVTGYPERVLTREGVEPSLLIPKPFDRKLLEVAISQAVSGRLPAARQRETAR